MGSRAHARRFRSCIRLGRAVPAKKSWWPSPSPRGVRTTTTATLDPTFQELHPWWRVGRRPPWCVGAAAAFVQVRRALEVDFVVALALALGRALAAAGRARARRRRHRLLAALHAVDELHVGALDLVGDALVAVPVRPLLGAEAALDVDLLALGEVLRGDLGLAAEQRHVEPRGDVDLLAAARLALVGGEAEAGDGRALRRVAEFGIAP